ncbi:MAG: SRPBCC family protein [Arenicellales bacterium]
MPSFEATTVIDAPAERVWSVLAHVSHWPLWLPTVTSVESLGLPALSIGARYKVVQPKLRPTVWSVVELSPGSHFSWDSRSPGVRVLAAHELRSVSAWSTSVSLRVAFSGPLSGFVGLIAGRLTREYVEREAAALKQRVERGA